MINKSLKHLESVERSFMVQSRPIPVIDLFAGPGGLGEGFSSVLDQNLLPVFSLKVSAEKDPTAHQTLFLRSIYRKFSPGDVPECYYQYLRGEITFGDFLAHPDVEKAAREAHEEALNFELGKDDPAQLDCRIESALAGEEDWVLIGGPPCQAYSLVGRSRRAKESKESFESDEKHFLYREYLRILRRHKPAVFIMENVKGLLSSRHDGSLIFNRIIADLANPCDGLEYQVRSLVKPGVAGEIRPQDFVIEAERFGIPQSRHRVILFGVRSDVASLVTELRVRPEEFILQSEGEEVTVGEVLSGLPPLRSRLSKERDGRIEWLSALKEAAEILQWNQRKSLKAVREEMERAIRRASSNDRTGALFITGSPLDEFMRPALKDWFSDARLNGVIQHETRSHMRSDLHRYLFVASFGRVNGISPKIADFPASLLPNHGNVTSESVPFSDRFRVQLEEYSSTTVVSHIAKDGHYFIHPDPSQCRSLTVREAARLQTFPDNYFFCGNRTEQYTQVGNAVPPLLAYKIAQVIARLMGAWKQRRSPRMVGSL
jgi:DNA (cytosine-5)-methyltransferase 1